MPKQNPETGDAGLDKVIEPPVDEVANAALDDACSCGEPTATTPGVTAEVLEQTDASPPTPEDFAVATGARSTDEISAKEAPSIPVQIEPEGTPKATAQPEHAQPKTVAEDDAAKDSPEETEERPFHMSRPRLSEEEKAERSRRARERMQAREEERRRESVINEIGARIRYHGREDERPTVRAAKDLQDVQDWSGRAFVAFRRMHDGEVAHIDIVRTSPGQKEPAGTSHYLPKHMVFYLELERILPIDDNSKAAYGDQDGDPNYPIVDGAPDTSVSSEDQIPMHRIFDDAVTINALASAGNLWMKFRGGSLSEYGPIWPEDVPIEDRHKTPSDVIAVRPSSKSEEAVKPAVGASSGGAQGPPKGGDDGRNGGAVDPEGEPQPPTPQEVYDTTKEVLLNTNNSFGDAYRQRTQIDSYDVQISSYPSSTAKAHPETGASAEAHSAMLKDGTAIVSAEFVCAPGEVDDQGNQVTSYSYQIAAPDEAYRPDYHVSGLAALAGVSPKTYEEVVENIHQHTGEMPTVKEVQAGFTASILHPSLLGEQTIIASTHYAADGPESKTEVVGISFNDAEHFARLGALAASIKATATRDTAHTQAFVESNQDWVDEEAAKIAASHSRANMETDDLNQVSVVALLEAAEEQRDAVLSGKPMDTAKLKRATRRNIRDAFTAITHDKDFNAIKMSADMVERMNASNEQKGLPPLSLEEIALITGRPVSSPKAMVVTAARINQYLELTTYLHSLEQLQGASTLQGGVHPAAGTPITSFENLVGITQPTDPYEAVASNAISPIVERYLAGSRNRSERMLRERRLRILFRHQLGIANNHDNASIEGMWYDWVVREEQRAIRDLRRTREHMRNEEIEARSTEERKWR